ncbi:hypothetical protein CcCBS67573_g03634 [Chytriomyces confervae]|uniref:Uncharacterized protein n=1 Tax=Chytriomyces confervae TaxID=246404 RepID=A0A507FFH6_9FUNG|nr:hypothetical protein CcCBS67573_g03634 [Chytriomyces confervae]
MAAQCTVLGSNNVFSVGALGGSGCVASAVYTGSVPPATCVTTATSYNPLATGATQQLDVIAPTITSSAYVSGTMRYTYNVNNYAQTIAFPSTTSVAGDPAATKTVTATLSGQNVPFTMTYSNGFAWNQQTIASWTTSGSKCQMVATAVGTSHLTSTGTTVTTVANGAVVTNVVMVGAAEVDASVGVALAGTPTVLTSKSYVPVDLQFPTSASLSFTTADIDLTISCTVIAETFTAKGLFDAANPEHGQGTLTYTVQCNLPPNSRYKVTGLTASGIQFQSSLRTGEWDDDDHLDSAPNNHLDGTYGSSMVGSSITNSQVTGVSQWSFSYNGGSGSTGALCGTTYRFPVAVNVCNWDAFLNKCDDANFVDFNLLVLAVGTPSCGFSFSVAAPNLGLSVNDGGDPLGANDEWIFRVYTGPSSSPPQQTFALTSLVADYSTDGGVTFPASGQVSIPVDVGHCFGTSIAGSADALAGQVKDISNAMVFATTSTDAVNYFTLLAYVIGSAPPTMTTCAFIKPNLKARYRLRMSIRLSTPTGLARRDSPSSAGGFQSLSTTFEVDTTSPKSAGLSTGALAGVVAAGVVACAVVIGAVFAVRKRNLAKRGVQEKVEAYKDLGAIVAM